MKKRIKKTLSLALAVLMLLLTLSPAGSVFAASTENWDLYNFVTGVKITDASGNAVTNPVDGVNYRLVVHFAEQPGVGPGTQLEYDDMAKLIYELPPNVTLLKDVSDSIYVTTPTGRVPVGSYTGSAATGKFSVEFWNVDNLGTFLPDGPNFIENYTNVEFTLEMDAQFVAGDEAGEQVIDFGDNYKVTFTHTPPVVILPSIEVDKKATNITNDGKINYTVTITGTGSDSTAEITGIKLTDKPFTRTSMNGVKTNITDAQRAAYSGFKYVKDGATKDFTPNWDANNHFVYEFDADGVVLHPGESITVTYSLDVDAFLSVGTALNSSYYVGNDVKVESSVGNDDDTVQTTLKSNTTTIAKTNSNNNANTWTATVGNGTMKLNGKKITDTQSSNNPTYPIVFPDSASIMVNFYNSPRSMTTASYSLTAQQLIDAGVASINTSNNELILNVPAADANRPGGGVYGDIYCVQLVYATGIPTIAPVESNSQSDATKVTHTNTIALEGLPQIDAKREFTGTVTAPAGITVSKTTGAPAIVDGKINYTVTIKGTGDNKSAEITGIKLKDTPYSRLTVMGQNTKITDAQKDGSFRQR